MTYNSRFSVKNLQLNLIEPANRNAQMRSFAKKSNAKERYARCIGGIDRIIRWKGFARDYSFLLSRLTLNSRIGCLREATDLLFLEIFLAAPSSLSRWKKEESGGLHYMHVKRSRSTIPRPENWVGNRIWLRGNFSFSRCVSAAHLIVSKTPLMRGGCLGDPEN